MVPLASRTPRRRPSPLRPLVAMALLLSTTSAPGAGPDTPPATAAPTVESLQREVDRLREAQQRMQEEIASLRRQLQAVPARSEVAAVPDPARFFTLNIRGEPVRGGAGAKVALVVFSDFNCSHCAAFEKDTLPRIDERYLKTGRVKLVFRDLPDRADADALVKAEAARCAGEQGRFWEMHDRLFADPMPFAGEVAGRHLQALDLDTARFNACLDGHRYREAIRRSALIAGRMDIHGTPSFLVGTVDAGGDVIRSTKVFTGAESFEEFRAVLDEALAAAAAEPKRQDPRPGEPGRGP